MAQKLCASKTLIYLIYLLQIISTFERQIFDFLGYMWLPILWNFFNIIFVIFAIFGVYQYRSNYILAYLVWTLIWLGWNVFIICYYLEVGTLRNTQDLLSFGTGSFSFWLINGIGCKPEYFSNDDQVEEEELNFDESSIPNYHQPVRPSVVNGCLMDFQYVEVIHAGIQLVLGIIGLILGIVTAHYYVTVVNPRRAKSKKQAMYSIEYSPQVNENGHNSQSMAETNLYSETNDGRGSSDPLRAAQMTPRRVKRRSHGRQSSRSMSANTKSMNRNSRNTRSTRSAGGTAGRNKNNVVNPVNRLMDSQQQVSRPGRDSSTSNDEARYGMVNPGFQSSRPNSVYGTTIDTNVKPNESGAERPPSALTSYSNFHGQRKTNVLPTHNMLTQESLNQYNNTNNDHHNPNSSFDDDLPPPPPPLSSSPTPLYTNSQPSNHLQSSQFHHLHHQHPDSDTGSATTNTTATAVPQVPVPSQRNYQPLHRRNEYVNMPVSNNPNGGEDNRGYCDSNSSTSSPMPPPSYNSPPPAFNSVTNVPPPLPPHSNNNRMSTDFSSDNNSSTTYRYSELKDIGYGDTQTLRAETKLTMPNLDTVDSSSKGGFYNNHPHLHPPNQQQQQQQPPVAQSYTTSHPHLTIEPKPELPSRVPTGHARRDRASLRAKHRRDLEQQQAKKQQSTNNLTNGHSDSDYGFSKQNGGVNQQPMMGNGGYNHHAAAANGAIPKTPIKNGGINRSRTPEGIDEQWYLHDSMKPVGASKHGGNCQCYRCQRKLTAI